jgi:hypothetical protein
MDISTHSCTEKSNGSGCLLQSSEYVASDGELIVMKELERMRIEDVVA